MSDSNRYYPDVINTKIREADVNLIQGNDIDLATRCLSPNKPCKHLNIRISFFSSPDRDGKAVFCGRDGTVVVRRVGAPGVVSQVKIYQILVPIQVLQFQEAAGPVGFLSAGGIGKRH